MIKYLKTVLLIAITAVLALTSCSNDETIEGVVGKPEDRQEIEFTLDMMSRATDRTINNLDTIWVCADDGMEEVFPFTPFIKDEYGRFVSEEKIFWPDGKGKVNFTAVWPNPKLLNITSEPGQIGISYTTPVTANKHYDLITAKNSIEKLKYNGKIPLSFSHAFAQIDFRGKIQDEADFRVEVYGIGLANFYNGIYNFSDDQWSTTSKNKEFIFSAPENLFYVSATPRSITDKAGAYYITPQTLTFNNYKVTPAILGYCHLRLYSKVYDKNGNLILPKEEWKEESNPLNVRVTNSDEISNFKDIRDISGCLETIISLSDNSINMLAGHKYIFTIDFTNGIGVYPSADPENPLGPAIASPMNMQVTVEEWSQTDFDRDAN